MTTVSTMLGFDNLLDVIIKHEEEDETHFSTVHKLDHPFRRAASPRHPPFNVLIKKFNGRIRQAQWAHHWYLLLMQIHHMYPAPFFHVLHHVSTMCALCSNRHSINTFLMLNKLIKEQVH